MNDKFLKPYDPKQTESRIYKLWENSGFFNPEKSIEAGLTPSNAKPFTIMMPPPNVTGILHMGHALMITLEDIMIRYKRMCGFRTLWLPGTDHAAIATQSRVEKDIYKKENKSRHDLGREELLNRVNKYAQESHDTIIKQVKTLGASCDWSREAFTLDEKRNLAVRTAFKKMYDDGLIYRKNRVINWDPKGQTTMSDDEIIYEERKAKLYTFKYSKDFPISIATTRPETKVGDTAVAVHPEDPRYKKFIGKTYKINFCDVPIEIKIVADKEVDKEFGTGAVGVTPAHSMTDWEIAKRHDLPVVQVINEFAKMTVGSENLKGKKVSEAREIIVEWLKKENLLEKEEEITNNIATAERTGGVIEPLPKLQWFIDVNKEFTIPHSNISGIKSGGKITLKEIMRTAVKSGDIKIIPEYFDKTYFHWIENLNDWCISRQIWYGHRIPVWYKDNEIYCGVEAPKGDDWKQDEDTLDTWFSSGLWTFSTLGWPENTKDLSLYHPTDILETGYEILFFWVARMILMTGYFIGTIPFHTVYLHGTVRDSKGRKMSKSLGNGVDPIEMSDKFGADAVRMSLVVANTPGTDTRTDENRIKGYKNFANKIWNATRYVLTTLENEKILERPTLSDIDAKNIDELSLLVKDITLDMDNNRIYMASEKLYQYFWHTFADKIIEESKTRLSTTSDSDKKSIKWTLLEILKTNILLLHPFMP
ncbi:valine--tRNA ligase, partial [Candidatus Nomurabacteria bacterium]|nr:valine--tRNA ligase [Candidatus Nomurabacteria bacterium]